METTTTETTETETNDKKPDIVRESIQAPHEFNVEETLKLKDDLLAAIRNEAQIDAEFASVKSEFKSRTEKAILEKDSILRKLTDGFEMRATRAVVLFNQPEHGRKTYVRDDNGEMIRDEPMSHADFNRPLFRNKDGKDATEPTDAELAAKDYPHVQPGEEFQNTEGEGTAEDLGRVEDVPGAGTTSVGEALNGAAIQTEQPKILIAGWGMEDWSLKGLRKAFRVAASKVWPEAAISPIDEALKKCETVEVAKELLRPHVVNGDAPELWALMEEAQEAIGDGQALRAIFAQVLQHYPAKYPGGDSEQNFNRFQDDVRAAIEEEIQRGRTSEQ